MISTSMPSSRAHALQEGGAVLGVAHGGGGHGHDARGAGAHGDGAEVAQRLQGALHGLGAQPVLRVHVAHQAQRGAGAGQDAQAPARLAP